MSNKTSNNTAFKMVEKSGKWNRENLENGDIVFWDNQESFVFSNHDHFCSFSDDASQKVKHLAQKKL
jgi:hypothetical protein